jgi:hypothetical protein
MKYVFSEWTIDGAPTTGNGLTVLMDRPHKIVAKFAASETTTPTEDNNEWWAWIMDHLELIIVAVAALIGALAVIRRLRSGQGHPTDPSGRVCPHCGFNNPPFTRAFCVKCGDALEVAES